MSKPSSVLRRRATKAPVLPLVSFDIAARVHAALTSLSEHRLPKPIVWFRDRNTLASIYVSELPPLIEIHEILNISALPVWVFDHILLHEFTHLLVPPREVDGKLKFHPPEFWELERCVSPEGNQATEWLFSSFHAELVRDQEEECIRVKRGWRKRTMDRDAGR